MEECESSNMIAYAIDLNENIKFTGSTGCGPRHGLIGGKKKKKLVLNEMRWTVLWFGHHRKVWARRAEDRIRQGLNGHACYAWQQAAMWEKLGGNAQTMFCMLSI